MVFVLMEAGEYTVTNAFSSSAQRRNEMCCDVPGALHNIYLCLVFLTQMHVHVRSSGMYLQKGIGVLMHACKCGVSVAVLVGADGDVSESALSMSRVVGIRLDHGNVHKLPLMPQSLNCILFNLHITLFMSV